ncbi:MAG: hypothetical protein IPL79_17725 [Myxococcales bacterium]|nr:hypothetical protein [Myxococcales bacterium]
MAPLPAGGIPKDQTIEGGAQVRVTNGGLGKIGQFGKQMINDQFGGGMCIPKMDTNFGDFCTQNSGGACNPGCMAVVNAKSLTITPLSATRMRAQLFFDLGNPTMKVSFDSWLLDCDFYVKGDNLKADIDISLMIKANGELGINDQDLTVQVYQDNNANTLEGPLTLSGCGLASDIVSWFKGSLVNTLENNVEDAVREALPTILPDPLGLAGSMDMGGVLPNLGIAGALETKLVPGGYATFQNNGLSLGMITAFNADRNPATRSAGDDNEASLCVPALAAPNLALANSSRGNKQLAQATPFSTNAAGADVQIGISETALDLAGHHLVTSGGACMQLGPDLSDQLRMGTLALLAPSVSEIADTQTEPLALVLRPQRAIDFSIGEGTANSPHLTLSLQDLEADMYAFLYERYLRVFTLQLTMSAGVNLEYVLQDGVPTLVPTLVGLTSNNIEASVINSEFVRETAADLESRFTVILNALLGQLTGAIPDIVVPEIAGLALGNIGISRVQTTQDDFLAIQASMTVPGAGVMGLSVEFDQAPSLGRAHEPNIDTLRAGLDAQDSARLPSVVVNVPTTDSHGAAVTWSWRVAGPTTRGMWRPFASGPQLVVNEPLLALQGEFEVQLIARRTNDSVGSRVMRLPVVIDGLAPTLLDRKIEVVGTTTRFPAVDTVSPASALQWAFGSPGDTQPRTAWSNDNSFDTQALKVLAKRGDVRVFVRDEKGNMSATDATLGNANMGCSASGAGAASLGMAAMALAWLLLRRRLVRRQRGSQRNLVATTFCLAAGAAMPACDCNKDSLTCELTSDCGDLSCASGEIGICFENGCICSDGVPAGRNGVFMDLKVDDGGMVWIAAYNQSYGDLVVAQTTDAGRVAGTTWEFVDGVPDGPVLVPDAEHRGGIVDPGENVGRYASLDLASDGLPMIAYYDRTNNSLKFARKTAEGWQSHAVDVGTGTPRADTAASDVGLYTSISIDPANGRPAISYLAQISDGDGNVTAELRFATAATASPASASDWTTSVVDSVSLPFPEADPYPLADGLGLWSTLVRDSTGAPHILYYDRERGDLKLVSDTGSGFGAPTSVDTAGDVGRYSSAAFDADDQLHVAYQSYSGNDLLYKNVTTGLREVVDTGYRVVGTTEDGLPKPELHFVGNDTQLIITPDGPAVVHQDSTSQELVLARRIGNGWDSEILAGNAEPYAGAYGFFASAASFGDEIIVGSYVIFQADNDQWVEVHRTSSGGGVD